LATELDGLRGLVNFSILTELFGLRGLVNFYILS